MMTHGLLVIPQALFITHRTIDLGLQAAALMEIHIAQAELVRTAAPGRTSALPEVPTTAIVRYGHLELLEVQVAGEVLPVDTFVVEVCLRIEDTF